MTTATSHICAPYSIITLSIPPQSSAPSLPPLSPPLSFSTTPARLPGGAASATPSPCVLPPPLHVAAAGYHDDPPPAALQEAPRLTGALCSVQRRRPSGLARPCFCTYRRTALRAFQHLFTACPHAGTIPPTTRKRKAAEATVSSDSRDNAPAKRPVASAANSTSAARPAPPTPTTTGMDSEEDYMSNISSDDEVMHEYSADEGESAGEGTRRDGTRHDVT